MDGQRKILTDMMNICVRKCFEHQGAAADRHETIQHPFSPTWDRTENLQNTKLYFNKYTISLVNNNKIAAKFSQFHCSSQCSTAWERGINTAGSERKNPQD